MRAWGDTASCQLFCHRHGGSEGQGASNCAQHPRTEALLLLNTRARAPKRSIDWSWTTRVVICFPLLLIISFFTRFCLLGSHIIDLTSEVPNACLNLLACPVIRATSEVIKSPQCKAYRSNRSFVTVSGSSESDGLQSHLRLLAN